MAIKKKYLRAAKFVFSLSLLAYLFSLVDINNLWTQLKELNAYVFPLAFCILFVQCLLSSAKWKIILTADDKKIPFWFLLKSYMIGNFISLFLPTSFGGDLYRIYTLRHYNKDYIQNTSSVLFDRISGLFALASISVISISLFYKDFINYKFLILYGIAAGAFWLLTSKSMITKLEGIHNKFIKPFIGVIESFHQYRKNKKILFSSLAISFIFQSNIVILNKFYCHALNIDLPISYLFMVIPIIYLTEALPISINGLGVRESAFVFFLTRKGVLPDEALAVGLLVITIRYLFSLLFGGTLFFREMVWAPATKDNAYKTKNLPLSME
jgi:uncharacterized protein (TIRG00374 family)